MSEPREPREPVTEAGRALIGDLMSSSKRMGPWEVNRAILAIEAAARAEALAEIRAGVEGLWPSGRRWIDRAAVLALLDPPK